MVFTHSQQEAVINHIFRLYMIIMMTTVKPPMAAGVLKFYFLITTTWTWNLDCFAKRCMPAKHALIEPIKVFAISFWFYCTF